MESKIRRKASLTPDAEALDCAKDLEVNASAVAAAQHENWLTENADTFAAQSDWHTRNGHPLADILADPGQASWKS